MSFPWFRLYAEFATDPVVQSLAFEDQRHFVVIMCLKCDGVIDRNISRQAKSRIIFRALGVDSVAADEAKRRLMEVGLIDNNWQIPAWNKRQFVSDHSTERSRKSRKTNGTGNGKKPLLQRDCNGPDTEAEERIASARVQSTGVLADAMPPKGKNSDFEKPVSTSSALSSEKPRGSARRKKTVSRETWNSYHNAFLARYGAEPVRNARVNGQMCQFIDRIGVAESPKVAEFFVKHNDRFYVQKLHPVGLLLQDAEKLRTEWATGRTMTATRANQTDRAASNLDAANQVIANIRARAE